MSRSLTPLPGCKRAPPPSPRAARKRLCRRPTQCCGSSSSPSADASGRRKGLFLARGRDALKQCCDEARFVEALDHDNCAWLYGAAVPERRERCEQPRVLAVLHEAARDILLRSLARLTAAQLQPLSLEAMCTLLRSDELRGGATAGGPLHEVELLGVIERWSEANPSCRTQCDVRKLLACLRWPLMTVRQLACLGRATYGGAAAAGGGAGTKHIAVWWLGETGAIQLCRSAVHAHARRCLRWKVVVRDSAAAYRRFARSSTDVGALNSDRRLLDLYKRRAALAPGLRQEDAAGRD